VIDNKILNGQVPCESEWAGSSFTRIVTSPGSEIFYENMCGSDLLSQENSVMVYLDPNPDVQMAIAHEAMRHLAVRSWKMVLPSQCESALMQLSDYHQHIGLATKEDIENLVLLPDAIDYNNHDQVLGYLGSICKQRNLSLLSYMPAQRINDLCERYGIKPAFWEQAGMNTVVSTYSNRSNLRDLVQSIGPSITEEPFVVQPRIKVRSLDNISYKELIEALSEAIAWNSQYHSPTPYSLFVQYANGSGGNFPVDRNFTVYGYDTYKKLDTIERFAAWLKEIAKENDVEVTPFAKLSAAYSFGVVIENDRCSSVGPRHQILDAYQSYRGFSYSTIEPDRDIIYSQQRELGHLLAHKFHDLGFRGAFGVDFFDYVTPSGKQATAVTETNLRLDGTTPYLGLFFKLPEWNRTLFVDGARVAQLSVLLPRDFKSSDSDALQNALAHFRALGIPLASREDPTGIIATNVPVAGKNGASIGIGLCSSLSDQFEHWMRLIQNDEPIKATMQ
jgi:hypothetical protein